MAANAARSFDLSDVLVIEGETEASELDQYKALQRAINSGMWSLQGSYGRTMMQAIEEGRCLLGRNPAHDYWGSRIPSRDEVQSGTKGSQAFVSDNMGAEWARKMARV